ncbi:hypothetical protein RAS1_42410 [Phycisphaerae bacterium RAS1]|nr:hypothetical protein RAS1_42410 [Phycisphaerae bacterium RAS1]
MIVEKKEVPGCRGTRVQELFAGRDVQVLLVEVDPAGEIPIHVHDCAATMVIVEGEARALGTHERVVGKGDVVVKAPREPHGFSGIGKRFSFVSVSDGRGIMHNDDWDLEYTGAAGEKAEPEVHTRQRQSTNG